jgi:hypothetical protein
LTTFFSLFLELKKKAGNSKIKKKLSKFNLQAVLAFFRPSFWLYYLLLSSARVKNLKIMEDPQIFISQEEKIVIVPAFRSPKLSFLSGEFGPFDPLTPIEVPLWLAFWLKKSRKCQIKPPAWMDAGNSKTL